MSLTACAELVRRGDPDRFLSAMTAPPEARSNLFTLYAFNLEVARAPWLTQEPMIAEMRIQFWRDVLDEIAEGKPARAHEVAQPLANLIRETPLDTGQLDQLVAARRWDIYREAFDDETAFDAHINATSGHLMWAACRALGAGKQVEPIVRKFAFGAGVANWLVAVATLKSHGRIALVDARPEATIDLAERALQAIKYARQKQKDVPKSAAPALRAGWRAETILKTAITQPSRVAQGHLNESEFSRRWSLLRRSLANSW